MNRKHPSVGQTGRTPHRVGRVADSARRRGGSLQPDAAREGRITAVDATVAWTLGLLALLVAAGASVAAGMLVLYCLLGMVKPELPLIRTQSRAIRGFCWSLLGFLTCVAAAAVVVSELRTVSAATDTVLSGPDPAQPCRMSVVSRDGSTVIPNAWEDNLLKWLCSTGQFADVEYRDTESGRTLTWKLSTYGAASWLIRHERTS
jgi:hypothetical protein